MNEAAAYIVLSAITSYNFLILLLFWHRILQHIDRVQIRLQDPTINFREAACDINDLRDVLKQERDGVNGIEELINERKDLAEARGVEEPRIRRRKAMTGEDALEAAGLTADGSVKRKMLACLDHFLSELERRFHRLNDLDEKFGFLLDVKETFSSGHVAESIGGKCRIFSEHFSEVDGKDLFFEIKDVLSLIKVRSDSEVATPIDVLQFIIQYGVDAFPNLRLSILLLLTISTSIASCERSFCKLKLILTYLRASISQQRLTDLAMISIERGTANVINYAKVLQDFAYAEARKESF